MKRARRLAATQKSSKAAVKDVESSCVKEAEISHVRSSRSFRKETKWPHLLQSGNKRTRKDKRPLPECSSQSDRSHSSLSLERGQTHTRREEGK